MKTVVLSERYEITIPTEARAGLGLCPGQKLQVIIHENRIELIPIRRVRDFRGFLRGMPADFEREPDRM
jgi:AbrB family looped-hinge helix DNA binding protein